MARVRGASPALSSPDRGIDDRDEEAERFARAGPGSDDEALAPRRLGYGLRLVPVQRDPRPTDPEYLARMLVQGAVLDQGVDGGVALIVRIDAD